MSDIVSWTVFGLIVGIVANALDPHPSEGGVLGIIILGVAGALVGGFLANLIFGIGTSGGFDFTSFAIAILGSLGLLALGRAFRNDGRYA